MTDLRQAAQQALDALAIADNIALVGAAYTPNSIDLGLRKIRDSATALKAALEQQAEPPSEWPLIKNILDEYGLQAISFVAEWKAAQQQAEPVGEVIDERGEVDYISYVPPVGTALYTTPPQRQWQGLTDEDIQAIHDTYYRRMGRMEFAQKLEAKLKEKNT